MKLEKNDIVEAVIDDNGLDGDGIAHIEGITVFVKNAIKGENVRAKILKVKNNLAFAIVDKLLTLSPNRIMPPCPYFNKCGGCSLQHIDYNHTLELKRDTLKQTLLKQGLKDINVLNTVPSIKPYHYRNKLSLPISGNAADGTLKIGFYGKGSHRIVDIEDCLLQNFDVKTLIKTVKEFMQENSINGYDEEESKGDFRHLTARHIFGTTIISIVTFRPLEAHLRALYEVLKKKYNKSFVFYSNLNDKNTNVIYGEKFKFVGSFIAENDEKIDGKNTENLNDFAPHPAAFFQVNDHIRELIYSGVKQSFLSEKEGVSEGEKSEKEGVLEGEKSEKEGVLEGENGTFCGCYDVLIDAYAGAGSLSFDLSPISKKVYSLEINKEAHQAAVKNKKEKDIQNLECLLGDCAELLPKVLTENKGRLNKTGVVLDPPRKGVERSILEILQDTPVQKIVYISCNPATLARDLKILVKSFDIESITPFDMFPQTSELETLTVLTKKST